MSEIDLVIKIRDGAQIIADACAEYLEKMAPKEAEWDPSKIKWEQAEGSKGSYERSDDVNNPEHKAMVKDLAAHDGRLTHEGLFYWLFKNGATVGRKKRGKREAKPAEAGEKIVERFPEDLRSMFSFEETADRVVVIRSHQYLGSEAFAKAASIVRDAGGSYISEGKNSRFEIPKQA